PAATEIERCCPTDAGRPGPPAEPRPCLHNQAVDARVGEPPARRDSGRPAANDHHFGIADGHTLFRDGSMFASATLRRNSYLVTSFFRLRSPLSIIPAEISFRLFRNVHHHRF